MKIKINKNGALWIDRGGKFKEAACPRSPRFGSDSCGDWCALFGEPEVTEPYIELELCEKTLVVDKEDFEDER